MWGKILRYLHGRRFVKTFVSVVPSLRKRALESPRGRAGDPATRSIRRFVWMQGFRETLRQQSVRSSTVHEQHGKERDDADVDLREDEVYVGHGAEKTEDAHHRLTKHKRKGVTGRYFGGENPRLLNEQHRSENVAERLPTVLPKLYIMISEYSHQLLMDMLKKDRFLDHPTENQLVFVLNPPITALYLAQSTIAGNEMHVHVRTTMGSAIGGFCLAKYADERQLNQYKKINQDPQTSVR